MAEESSGAQTSSWDPQEDHRHLVGKNQGVKGAVCERSDYPLYGMSCQAAATSAAHNCVLAVPPTLYARGEGRRQDRAELGQQARDTAATPADTSGYSQGNTPFSWGNTRCGEPRRL